MKAQTLEVNGGISKNVFYDTYEGSGHYNTDHSSEFGHEVRIEISEIPINQTPFGFTIGYSKYGGNLEASDGALGGGYRTVADVKKQVISWGVFPLNSKLFGLVHFSLGVEVSHLIVEEFSGIRTGWRINAQPIITDIRQEYESYSANVFLGLRGRLSYQINLSNNVSLAPQYQYYIGLTREFQEFPNRTKSMRHFLGIGIRLNLGTKLN